jgi:hypothetical protein
MLNREKDLVLMKKRILALTFILAMLFSISIGEHTKLGIANPWYEDRWMEPPVISTNSPTNETYSGSILLNFTVSKPEKWKSSPTTYLGTPTRYGDVQQFDSVKIELDGKTYRSIEVHNNLSSPFSYSEDLANLEDGVHNLRIYAYGTGVVEGCEWSPNTSVEISSKSDLMQFILDTTSPVVSVLSVENKTYYSSDILLDFTVNEPTSQLTFSLDGQDNVTITGNTTLTDLIVGKHKITLYAVDEAGNTGSSETVYFTIEIPEPFPTTLLIASVITIAAVSFGLLVYFKKRKH